MALVASEMEMLTVSQAAARLGMSAARVAALLREGQMSFTTDRRGWKVIPESELRRYAQQRNARLRSMIVDFDAAD